MYRNILKQLPRAVGALRFARRIVILFVGTLTIGAPTSLSAADPAEKYTGPDGFAVVVLKTMEKSGVFSATWGGKFEIAAYNEAENCDEDSGECYEPITRSVEFKIENENPVLVNFLKENPGKEMFVRYNLPLFGDKWQLVDAMVWSQNPPRNIPASVRVPPSGSRRNFVTFGRVLRLQREGTVQKIWEGLYLDPKKRKVYPVSITDEKVILFLEQAMIARKGYFIGISVSYFPGFRNSTHDIYEVNYTNQPAAP